MHVVRGRPNREYPAHGDLRANPWIGIRVNPSRAEKEQRRRSQQPLIYCGLPRSDDDPRFERGAEVMQREQAPSGAPEQEVRLAPDAVHVGEEP